MLTDAEDFAEFIKKEIKPGAKVVEVGIGQEKSVFKILKKPGFNVIAIDLKSCKNDASENSGIIKISAEKAFEKGIFSEADAVYAIRPNEELLSELIKIAEKLKIKLFVRPFKNDEKPEKMRLVNYKKCIIWVFEG